MRFGDKLRELRDAKGMTQAELAEASGLPVGSIRNYEQNQREPLWDAAFKLAKALGVGCDVFEECVGAESEAAPKKGRGRPRKAAD